MRKIFLLSIMIPASLLLITTVISCGDDDDDSDGALSDDEMDDDIDDDADDDADDDVNDDINDDANDDADDDTEDCVDEDGDNYGDNCPAGPVCDDTNAFINPGAPELPDDGIDQNCDDIDLLLSDDTGIFVAATGDDANLGTMAEPKLTINAGARLALKANKSVFVAAGEYIEDVETLVSLFGGYESVGWTRDIENNVTTIIADWIPALMVGEEQDTDRGSDREGEWNKAKTDNASSVAIQGFTISGGSSTDTIGVINYGTVTLINNIISGQNGIWDIFNKTGKGVATNSKMVGGDGSSCGVYNYRGTATLVGNTINGGWGGQPGFPGNSDSWGVFNYAGTAILVNNIINGGFAWAAWGVSSTTGVYNTGGIASLTNNIIHGGLGLSSHTGVENYNSSATLINNVINGGGIGPSLELGRSIGVRNYDYYPGNDTNTMLINNIINAGWGVDDTYGVCIEGMYGTDTALLKNNNFWGAGMDCKVYHEYSRRECAANTADEVNACEWTGCTEASGNISANPLFVAPFGGDYHLQSISPCVDTGIDPAAYIDSFLVDFDFEGDTRPYGPGWDVGVDEWRPAQ